VPSPKESDENEKRLNARFDPKKCRSIEDGRLYFSTRLVMIGGA
jgi:hypothetical protein